MKVISFINNVVFNKIFVTKVAKEIRDAVAKAEKSAFATAERRIEELLSSMGWKPVEEGVLVDVPLETQRYQFGYQWWVKGGKLLGVHSMEFVFLEDVKFHPLEWENERDIEKYNRYSEGADDSQLALEGGIGYGSADSLVFPVKGIYVAGTAKTVRIQTFQILGLYSYYLEGVVVNINVD